MYGERNKVRRMPVAIANLELILNIPLLFTEVTFVQKPDNATECTPDHMVGYAVDLG